MDKPQNGSRSLHHVPNETPWSSNPLGIHSSHDSYHPDFPTIIPSPRTSEPLMELSSGHLNSPQPRRIYTPIAPLPFERPQPHTGKRLREKDEDIPDESKKRKRSDSITSAQPELSDEDKLLLQLKEEESMPWKDIAARFQSELGKTYQIPALQMRLKRLRERMRVWTDTDVKALRMAYEYWEQSKFDIIAHKVSSLLVPKYAEANIHRCLNSAFRISGQPGNVHENGLLTSSPHHMRNLSTISSKALRRTL